jgi:hypothetical protein
MRGTGGRQTQHIVTDGPAFIDKGEEIDDAVNGKCVEVLPFFVERRKVRLAVFVLEEDRTGVPVNLRLGTGYHPELETVKFDAFQLRHTQNPLHALSAEAVLNLQQDLDVLHRMNGTLKTMFLS